MMAAVLGFNLLSDAFDRALDPHAARGAPEAQEAG